MMMHSFRCPKCGKSHLAFYNRKGERPELTNGIEKISCFSCYYTIWATKIKAPKGTFGMLNEKPNPVRGGGK